jgi:hypothetical protein
MTTISPPYIQQPSTIWVPERKGSYGNLVVDFANQHGIAPDAEQARDIDCLTSYGPYGQWLTLEVCVVEGRQNGKTKRELLPIVLTDLFELMLEPDRIVWTAHLMSTTLDTFEEVRTLIDTYPDLSKRVKSIELAKTQEAVILMDGSRLDFRARVGGGGRGLSGARLVFDEALYLRAEHMGALIPVLSSRKNPQIMYGSSPGKADSTQLLSLQVRGRRLNDPSLIFIEYKSPGGWDEPGCARGLMCDHIYDNPLNLVEECGCGMHGNHAHGPEDFVPTGRIKGCAMDREENWRAANHAINAGRMQRKFVEAEARALRQTPLGVLEFGRERMGWSELAGDEIDIDKIPQEKWDAQRDPLSEIVGDVCFAIDAPPSSSHLSIAAAGLREDGGIHFGVIAYGRGMTWAVKRLQELTQKHSTMCGVLWQPTAPVGALKHLLEAAGVNMQDVTEAEYYASCGAMKEHLMVGDAWHVGSEILDTAFKSSKRVILPEGAWKFGRRKSAGDISGMVASALAIKGVDENAFKAPGVWEL